MTPTPKDAKVIDRNTFLREWNKDLRSGEYEQCRGTICSEGRVCCLGVARHTMDRLGFPKADWNSKARHELYPPDSLMPASEKLILPDGNKRSVTGCNDHLNMTFPQIADAIERTYPEAFTEAKS